MSFIDAVLPGAANQAEAKTNLEFDQTYSGQLATVLDLAAQIPPHLITLSDAEYYVYIAALSTIREILPEWQARGGSRTLKNVPNVGEGLNPATLVREALRKCPDNFPTPDSHQFTFITDAPFKASLQEDVAIIERALTNQEWKTATVMAGAVIEAVLLWALEQKEAKQPGVPLAKAKALKLRLRGDPLNDWELHPYVAVAADLGVIAAETKTECSLAKDYRNLIHPGRAIREKRRTDRGTAFSAVAALDHVVRDVDKWNSAGQP